MENKKITEIYVTLNGSAISQCYGLDVAKITSDAIIDKIANSDNFTVSIQKVTRVIPIEEPKAPEADKAPEAKVESKKKGK